jgi:hypothetical protein
MICTRCGKAFISIRSNALYCSRECLYQAYLERKKQKYQESHITKPTIRKCLACGQEYTATNPKQLYCNDKCRKRYWWRGNLSPAAVRRKKTQELCKDAFFCVWQAEEFLKTRGRTFVFEWLKEYLGRNYPDFSAEIIRTIAEKTIDKFIKDLNIETPEMLLENLKKQIDSQCRASVTKDEVLNLINRVFAEKT